MRRFIDIMMKLNENIDRQRNENIDLIRAMAWLAVVGLHSFAKDEDISSWFYYLCGFAVPFFFMASGFFCWIEEGCSGCIALAKYWALLKLYLVGMLLWFCLKWWNQFWQMNRSHIIYYQSRLNVLSHLFKKAICGSCGTWGHYFFCMECYGAFLVLMTVKRLGLWLHALW